MISACLFLGLGLLACMWLGGLISHLLKLDDKMTGYVVYWLFCAGIIACLFSLS